MKRIIGIDPGFTGALARLEGQALFGLMDPPIEHFVNSSGKERTRYRIDALRELLATWACPLDGTLAVIEKQHAFPKQGGVSNFTIGGGYYLYLGLLSGLRIPYLEVTSNEWKKAMLLGHDKSAARKVAAALFPGAELGKRKDEGRAEALLIAEYGRQKVSGS